MPVVVAVAAFLVMEPLTAALHRWVFHGRGWALHRTHHRPPPSDPVELNDLFPVGIALVTIAVMATGAFVPGLGALLWTGTGMTAYGAAYAAVHDLYIHRRFGVVPEGLRIPGLERLRAAHLVHHRHEQAPFGMLAPVVPARLRPTPRAAAGPVVTVAPADVR